MSPTIDVVVVNYHTEDDLQRFLDSFDRYGPVDGCTLTVVDVDVPPSERWMGDFTYVQGRRIGMAGNVGYSGACNFGAALNTGDVIALFNADVRLASPACIEGIADDMMASPSWGIVGPRQVNSKGQLTHAGIMGTNANPQLRGWLSKDRYPGIEPAVSVSGSAYFVKRSVWDELTECPLYRDVAPDALGAFLPTVHYYEETFCSYHARAHGHEVVYHGGVTFMHEWHQASPVGGHADQQMPKSREYFRRACDHHGIERD